MKLGFKTGKTWVEVIASEEKKMPKDSQKMQEKRKQALEENRI